MSDFSTSDDLILTPAPLTMTREDGRPYARFDDVERAIAEVLGIDPTGAILLEAPGKWKTQTFVYFARNGGRQGELRGKLVREIMTRAGEIVKWNSRGFSPTDVEVISTTVIVYLVKLLFPEKPTRMSEYLEVDFKRVIVTQTVKQHPKFKDKPKPHMVATASTTISGSDPLDKLVDEDAESALAVMIRQASRSRLRELLGAVKDESHRKAFILRKLRRWPMTHSDPSVPTVTGYFGLRPSKARTVQNWINQAIKEMREAFGEIQ